MSKITKIKVTTYFKDLLKTENAIGQIEDSSIGSYLREVFDDIDSYKEYPDELFDIIRLVSIEQENGDFHDETFTTIVFKELKSKKFYSFVIHDNGSISTDAVTVDQFLTEVKPKTKKKTVYE